MSLTMGTGPLASTAHAPLNVDLDTVAPKHLLFFDEVPRRVRGELAGRTVLDTRRARMLHESRLLPQWYVPLDDVDASLLTRTDHATHCPFKGDASYWTVRVGDRVEENGVWGYEDPKPAAAWLRGHVAFYFSRLDRWWEEDEEVVGHPRDPYHRVDTRPTSDVVTVRVGGAQVARSEREVKLFETGLPTRLYLPLADVDTALLRKTDTTTLCPYKGTARYYTVTAGGTTATDAAWTYPEPLPEALGVGRLVSFLGDGVEVSLDPA